MRHALTLLDAASRSLSYFLGLTIIGLAGAFLATSRQVPEIAAWAQQMFGPTFLVLLAALVVATLFCWTRMRRAEEAGRRVWYEAGMHAANGIAILALTYTLLGISLGIGSMAGQVLTPETVQDVIQGLTENFSMAFMTTVVGLPVSACMRALVAISEAQQGAEQ